MDALQHLKGLEALKKMNPETEEDKKKRRRGIIFGAVINFIVSLAMIIVGGIHNNDTDCPGRQATEFLIVGGSILLCSSLLKLQYLAPLPKLHKVVDIGSPLLDFVYFIIVIWGSARVFGAYSEWTDEDTSSPYYCANGPFMMAFVTLILFWILMPLIFCLTCCCCCICCAIGAAKARTQPNEEDQPNTEATEAKDVA